jgi:23S rRNA pseudouridine1911/1915/1917 synthase
VVVVHAAREVAPGSVEIAAERDGVVAAIKPAGLPTIADHRGNDSLLSRLARRLGVGEGELHATSRLDVGVSGVVLFARTREARERLAAARDTHGYHRRYLAIATRCPMEAEGTWDAPIGRAPDPRLRRVGGRDATSALTRYRLLAAAPAGQGLLLLEPETGRTHQLRVHAAAAGLPLLGDGDYGGPVRLVLPGGTVKRLSRVALHAFRVDVPAASGERLRVEAPLPDELAALWKQLGGEAEAWQNLPR